MINLVHTYYNHGGRRTREPDEGRRAQLRVRLDKYLGIYVVSPADAPIYRYRVSTNGRSHRFRTRAEVFRAVPGLTGHQLGRALHGESRDDSVEVSRVCEDWNENALPGCSAGALNYFRKATNVLCTAAEADNCAVNVASLEDIAQETWAYFDAERAEEPARYFAQYDAVLV